MPQITNEQAPSGWNPRYTSYTWRWAPTNNDFVADPTPNRTIEHGFQLGGGPLEAKHFANHADAYSRYDYGAVLNGQTFGGTDYIAASSQWSQPTMTQSIPTAPQTQSMGPMPPTQVSATQFDFIAQCTVDVSAYAEAWWISGNGSSRATAQATNQTAAARLVP
jgi:hypothetical protein